MAFEDEVTAVLDLSDGHRIATGSSGRVPLAHAAPVLFESQPPAEKRKLLNSVLSNCTWKGGELTAKYRQPFDVLGVAVASERQRMGEGSANNGQFENWLPTLDSNSKGSVAPKRRHAGIDGRTDPETRSKPPMP